MASNAQVELTFQNAEKSEDNNKLGTKRRNSGLETEFAGRIHELNNVVRRKVSSHKILHHLIHMWFIEFWIDNSTKCVVRIQSGAKQLSCG